MLNSIIEVSDNTNDHVYDYIFKVLIIGDAGTGKTSIVKKFTKNLFEDKTISTIGVDFSSKEITLNDSNVRLLLWDTAGQERFKALTNSYYKGAHAAIIVYDISSRESFDNVKYWITEVLEKSIIDTIILVGSKHDTTNRKISFDEGYEFASKHELLFIETSSKTGYNIERLFKNVTEDLLLKNKNKQRLYKLKNNIPDQDLSLNNNNNNNYINYDLVVKDLNSFYKNYKNSCF